VIYLIANGDTAAARTLYEQLARSAPFYGLRAADIAFGDYLASFPDNADARAIRDMLQARIDSAQALAGS